MGLWRSLVVDVFEVLLARNAWEKRKLGETNSYFTDGNYGESYPKESELSDKENGVPFLRGSNLRNGELIEDNANYITKEKHAELTSGHLVEDDIVLAVRGSLGALGYVKDENIDWNINSQLAVIRTDKSELSGKFLVQFLLSWRGQKELLSRNTGTALKQLPIKQLKDVPVPIVNLDEQKEIGALFSSIDNLIAATQRRIDALEQAKKALLQRLFDQSWRFNGYSDPWEKRKLGELAKVRTGRAFKSSSFSPNGKYYVVTNKDIGGPQISTHMDGDRIDITNPVDIAKYSLSGRNLLVTMDGVNIGKTAMYSNEDAVLAQRVGRLTSSSLDFVHQITSQKNFLTRMNELSVGNAIKHISLKQISDYAVNVPQQTSERQLIGQTLSLLDNLIAATQSRLSSLELLKKSLLQDLFI